MSVQASGSLSSSLPQITSDQQNQNVSQVSPKNTSGYKDFTDLQVNVTGQAIENIRTITSKLNLPAIQGISKESPLSNQILFNVEYLNNPYKTGVPTIEDLPEYFKKEYDVKRDVFNFTSPHGMAEAVNLTKNDVKGEFPELKELQKEVSQLKLKPHEDKLYGLIINGVKFAFFPPTKDQQKLATFEILKLKDLLKIMSALEDAEFNESTLITSSRIISRQVLKLTRDYADIALKNFPEAFEPQSKVNWTLSKVEALVKVQVVQMPKMAQSYSTALPQPTSTTQISAVSQVSPKNTSEYKDFTDLQVRVTRQTIENIRSVTKDLNGDVLTAPLKTKINSSSEMMVINVECLKKPYKTDTPSIEDIPDPFHKKFDFKKYEIKFASPHGFAELAAQTMNNVKGEFPELKELLIERDNLSPIETTFYCNIINGIGQAMLSENAEIRKKMTSLNLEELVRTIQLLEDAKVDYNKGSLCTESRIVICQALKMTKQYSDIANKNFPGAFTDQKERNWNLEKLKAIADINIT